MPEQLALTFQPIEPADLDARIHAPAINVVQRRAGRGMLEQFREFHLANPRVFSTLASIALALKARGWKKGSISLIFEQMRWAYAIQTQGAKYALDNRWRAGYARLLGMAVPGLEGFFETRQGTEDYTVMRVEDYGVENIRVAPFRQRRGLP